LSGGGEIPQAEKVYLEASKQSYKSKEQRQNIPGYNYDPELSTKRTAIYVGPSDVIVANRGTDASDVSDLKQDALIAIGKVGQTDRVKRAEETAREVKNKYNKPIVFTGHSLGASVAQELAEKTGSKSIVFNPGASPLGVLNKKYKNSKVFSTGIDPIGLFAKGKTFSKPTQLNIHSLSNFF
jgi:hypothetical protein